jgi:hypothetical protein
MYTEGSLQSASAFQSVAAPTRDWFIFEVLAGKIVVNVVKKGDDGARIKVATSAAGAQDVLIVDPAAWSPTYKVLDSANVASTTVASAYISPEAQKWLDAGGSTLIPFSHKFSLPTGTPTDTYAYVYLSRAKTANPAVHAVEQILNRGASARYWTAPSAADPLLGAAGTTTKYDVRFLNDASWYTPAWIKTNNTALSVPSGAVPNAADSQTLVAANNAEKWYYPNIHNPWFIVFVLFVFVAIRILWVNVLPAISKM